MSRDVRASVAREFESATRDIPGVTLRPAEEANTAQWVTRDDDGDDDDCGDDCGECHVMVMTVVIFIFIFVFFQIIQCDRRRGVKLKTSVSDWPTFQLKPMWSELKSAVVPRWSDMIGSVISVISLHHHSFDQCWQWQFVFWSFLWPVWSSVGCSLINSIITLLRIRTVPNPWFALLRLNFAANPSKLIKKQTNDFFHLSLELLRHDYLYKPRYRQLSGKFVAKSTIAT